MTFQRTPVSMAVMLAVASCAAQAAEQTLEEVRVSAASEAPSNGYQPLTSRASTKTDAALRDTPQSVSVVTSQQIKDQAVQSMADAVRYTPGVTFAQGEGNRDAAVIRGSISTSDFFLDGVRDDTQYYRDLYNIDRVEILKGANGLAFGRGGSGGVINRVSKEADWTTVREISVSAGSFDHKRAALDIGGALTPELAGRVNVVSEDSGSYRDGVNVRRNGISPTVTFMPSDRTKVVLSAEYFNDLRVTDRGVPSQNGKPYRTDASTFFGNAAQSPTETSVRALGATIEHRFDNGVMVTNKTRYADYDKYYQNVYANGAVTAGGTVALAAYHDNTQRQNLFNQTDAVYKFATGRVGHQLLTGVEVGRQDTDNFRINGTVAGNAGGANAFASNPQGVATFAATRARDSSSQVDVAAVYLQDQLTFSRHWQAVLGLRHDHFTTDFNDKMTPANSGKVSNSELSPRAALIYKPVDPLSLYVSYSKAFVPRAGDQLSSLTAANRNFDPESFVNKEVGAKWDVRPDLSLSAALFRLERGNVAVPDPAVAGNTILVNGQVVRGAELAVTGRVTKAWSVVGGYAHADSEISKSQNATIVAGNETSHTPRHTFSLWNRYDFNDRYGAALGFISRSGMYALDDNQVRLPGYGRVDAAVFYNASRNLKLQLNIENLLNREYVVNAHNNNNIMPGSPIAARLSATYRF